MRRWAPDRTHLKINDLTVITSDVVETARITLVIGETRRQQDGATYRWRSHTDRRS